MEFSAVLGSRPIMKLKKVWSQLDSNLFRTWEDLVALLSPEQQYKNYKERLRDKRENVIPILGIHLQELIRIDQEHPDYVDQSQTPSPSLINVQKLVLRADYLVPFIKFQQLLKPPLPREVDQNIFSVFALKKQKSEKNAFV